jgi:hypothetical protein
MRRLTIALPLAVLLLVGLLPLAATAAEGAHSDNLTHIRNLGYKARNGGTANFGTDIEFVRLDDRQYALAGSYRNGLQIVDITNPRQASIVSVYDCGVTQGDVQVFRRADRPGRTFITYTSDTFGDGTSTCYREAAALGFEVKKDNGSGKNGTFIADITNPRNPTTVSFVEVAKGSHNQTVHPGGRFLYNSNSDLITSAGSQAIEVYDITRFRRPKLATKLALPLRPGLGTESHDITFNKSGSRAYSAALSQTVIIGTRRPATPRIISSFSDPTINVVHQSDPFTLTTKNGKERDFLIVEDEYAGAAGGPHCPSGGVHIYETTGALEKDPEKVGYWNISDAGPTPEPTGRCTAHVFDIREKAGIMTIAFYNGGVRVVDISALAGYSLGDTQFTGAGMREVAFYKFEDADTWAAKTPRVERDGDFYLYGNDINRGLDIYRYDAGNKAGRSADPGTWISGAQAGAAAATPMAADYKPFCLLPQE